MAQASRFQAKQALTGCVLLCVASAATAQEQAIDGQDIIITASKRPERLQDAPSSVVVLSGERLAQSVVRDFDDLARVLPSLSITKTTQPANNSINIRGVGTYAFSIAARSSVAVVVDEVPLSAQAQAFRPLTDVAQVEVLRGPQSTLFGTSASAGAILITTKDPTDTASGSARLLVTSDHEWRLDGSISGPLAPGLSLRLTAGTDRYRGNLQNIATGRWAGGHVDRDVRMKLLWRPTSSTRIVLSPYWSRTDSSCCTWAYRSVSPGVTFGRFRGFAAPHSAILVGIRPGPNNRLIAEDVDPRGDGRDIGASLKVQRDLGAYRLTWISAYDDYRLIDRQDTDGTAFNWGPGGADIPGAVTGGSANGGSFRFRSLTQELKLASPDAGPFRYVAGLYLNRVRSARDFVRGSNELQQDGTLATVPPTTSAYSSFIANAETLDVAAYGQGTLVLARHLDLVAGLRLNHERIRYRLLDRANHVGFGDPGCSTATPSGLKASTCDRFNAASGRAALTFRPTRRLLLFAGYDRGYKGAAYDITSTLTMRSPVVQPGPDAGFPIADAVAAKQPIAPETVDAFQLGAKARLAGGITANITLFDEVFHHFQAQSRDELTRQNVLNSIPRMTSRGAELEIMMMLPSGLALSAFGAFTDARIDAFPNAPCFPSQTEQLGCVNGQQDLSGSRLSQAPRWNASINGEYRRPLGRGYIAELSAGWHWQSLSYLSLLHDPQSVQDVYGTLDLSAGLVAGRWQLRAFCINAFDQSFALARGRDTNWNINPYGTSAGPVTDAVRWTPARDSGRYVGLELSASY